MFGSKKKAASQDAKARHSKPRRKITALLLVVLFCCLGWWGIELLVRVDRYRPFVISKLEDVTRMPVAIENLDLALRPLPAILIHHVSIGEGNLKAEAAQVTIRPRLRSLFKKRLDVTEIAVKGLMVTAPGDIEALAARLDALDFSQWKDTGAEQESDFLNGVTLDEVRVDDGRICLADTTEAAETESSRYSFDLAIQDVFSDVVSIDLRGILERQGVAANLDAKGEARRVPEWRIDGIISVSGGDTRMAPELEWLPRSHIDMQVKMEDAALTNLVGTVSGNVEVEELAGFTGPYSAQASLGAEGLSINAFQWDSPAAALKGDLTAEAIESLDIRVAHLKVTPEGARALAALVPAQSFRLEPQDDAVLEAKELTLDTGADGSFGLRTGSGEFQGIEVVLPDGTKPFGEITGRVEVNDWVLKSDVSCQGLALTGTVKPDFAKGCVAVDLSGTAELNRDRLARMLALDAVTETAGTVKFSHIKGTFDASGGLPPDLSIDGTLSNGKFAVKTASYSDSWSAVEATFAAGPGAIETHVHAESGQQGPLEVQGRYNVTTRTWEGQVIADIERFGHLYSGAPEAGRYIAAALDAYGSSPFHVTTRFPSEKTQALSVEFERASAPPLSGNVEFAPEKEGWGLRTGRLDAEIPLTTFTPLMPKLNLDGVASLKLEATADDAFVVDADLSQGAIKTEQHIEKKTGQPFTVRLAGTAWTPQTLQIACMGESIEGRFDEGRLRVDNLDLALEPLAALLSNGGTAGGRVAGSLATNPTTLNLMFEDVTLGLSPEVTLASINGRVGYDAERWSVQNLALRGAESDCTVNAAWHNEQCEGEIRGEQLDVNALLELYEEAKAFKLAGEEEAAPSKPLGEFKSRFTVAVGTTHYRRTHIQEARASLLVSNDGLRVENFSGTANGGLLSGDLTFVRTTGGPTRSLKVNLSANGVDASFLDELFFRESREFQGRLDGTVNFETIFGDDVDPWANLNGTAVIDGSHGTFGKHGLATKVLTVLRTTEIVRLRLPSLKDEGLRFTSCKSKFVAEDGVVTVEQFELKNPSLEMRGSGVFDFPNEQSDVRVAVNVLEAVTGLADKVPIVGKAANKIGEIASVSLRITGPPLDPNVAVVPGERALTETAVGVVKGVAKTGEKAGKGVKDGAKDAVRDILGRSKKEKAKEE